MKVARQFIAWNPDKNGARPEGNGMKRPPEAGLPLCTGLGPGQSPAVQF